MYIYLLAKLWHVISLLKTELGKWHSHCDFPTSTRAIEGSPQLFDEVEEHVLVGEFATAIGCSGVLPVEIESIEVVLLHEF